MTAPPAAIAALRAALDQATLVDDNPAYILGKLLDALHRNGWQIVPAKDHTCVCYPQFIGHADGCPTLTDPDRWLRCSGLRCLNSERLRFATERGWQQRPGETWFCPTCATARTNPTTIKET